MFLEAEMEARRGWGLSSVEQGIDFLNRTSTRQLAITHHGPARTDDQLASLQAGLADDQTFFAYQNQQLAL